jgi:hypothetical protein
LVQPLRYGYSRLRSGITLGVDLDSEREIAAQTGGRKAAGARDSQDKSGCW